jgi:hypothetical protein
MGNQAADTPLPGRASDLVRRLVAVTAGVSVQPDFNNAFF